MTAFAAPDELATILAAHVGTWLATDAPSETGPYRCELMGPPPSGNSNVTLPFDIEWCDGSRRESFILRMQHPENQIFLDADVLREYAVLAALADEPSVPSPTPRWAESDATILGQPFFVMNRVPGSVPAGMPSIHVTGWLAEQPSWRVKRAAESTLAALAAVHRFDWSTHLPALGAGPNGSTISQRLRHLRTWYEWVVDGRTFPTTDAGLAYLEATVEDLTPVDPVLVWGDARMGNTLFEPDGRVAALLDWELASAGSPALDLGWWLMFEEFSTTAHGVEALSGFPNREETLALYAAHSGFDPADVAWYETFAAWTVTVTVIRMADIAVAAGRLDPGTTMGRGNLTAQMLAGKLGLEVPELDPDYALRRNIAPPPKK